MRHHLCVLAWAVACAALVTPAVEHVELRGTPTSAQQWELVRFMADVLTAANEH